MILEGFGDDDGSEGVWPENEAGVTAFLRVQTQWRVACPGDGTFRRVGLDYGGVRHGLELAGIEMTPQLFDDLQCVEAGVILADREEITW